jgi:hypothetical protein
MPVYPATALSAIRCASTGCLCHDRVPRYPSDLTDKQWSVLEPWARQVMRDLTVAVGRPMVHDQGSLRAGIRSILHECLGCCGYLCAATGRPAEALTMWAASTALAARYGGTGHAPAFGRYWAGPLRAARQELGPDRTRAAEDRGAAMNLAAAAEYALMLTAPAAQ